MFVRVVFFLFLFAAGFAGGLGYWGWSELHKPGPATQEVVFNVPRGAGTAVVGERLEQAGVVRDARFVRVAARITGQQRNLKAGEYAIPPGLSVMEVIDLLVGGQSIQYQITFPEGLTSTQMMRVMLADDVLTGEISAPPAEGSLLPESYGVTRGETRDALIARMANAQDQLMAELWPNRAEDLPFETQDEAIRLASVVEKEAGGFEHAEVAAVFVNRLRKGMRLEADATVRYGVNGGDPLLGRDGKRRGLFRSELNDASNPYNSYEHDGLPPTPISNPGRASIEGVLNPPDTPYFFFVADGTGGHVFAETYREHQRNVAQWRRIEREMAQ